MLEKDKMSSRRNTYGEDTITTEKQTDRSDDQQMNTLEREKPHRCGEFWLADVESFCLLLAMLTKVITKVTRKVTMKVNMKVNTKAKLGG